MVTGSRWELRLRFSQGEKKRKKAGITTSPLSRNTYRLVITLIGLFRCFIEGKTRKDPTTRQKERRYCTRHYFKDGSIMINHHGDLRVLTTRNKYPFDVSALVLQTHCDLVIFCQCCGQIKQKIKVTWDITSFIIYARRDQMDDFSRNAVCRGW